MKRKVDSNRLALYFHTLRKVTFTQVYYQVIYKFFSRFSKPKLGQDYKKSHLLAFQNTLSNQKSFSQVATFQFLNLEHTFQKIDWNFNKFGKLWTYNLNYFDFLNQEDITKQEGLQLIEEFCAAKETHKDGYEPYPISLRGINWVKFLSQHGINKHEINQQLHNDFLRLNSKLEYHLLANHLIENAFSLLFGAYYFQDEKLYSQAKKLLKSQLHEQILPDGAHYELSPMYHCIMLHRVLDCYNLVSNNHWKNKELVDLLYTNASKMLGWLKAILLNGKMPMVNDTTLEIAPTPSSLFEYANRLKVDFKNSTLKESGYRKLKTEKLNVLFDVGQISPSYQPGHSHADSLQVIVHSEDVPLIVDTGISTYEKNERRHLERSTSSHNTVTVNNQNSSHVWSGFRVAKRATVKVLKDEPQRIIASHNGYRDFGVTCHRAVKVVGNSVEIIDAIIGTQKDDLVQGHLHLHPDVAFNIENNVLTLNRKIEVSFPKDTVLEILDYQFCKGFNHLIPSTKISYTFSEDITFTLKHS